MRCMAKPSLKERRKALGYSQSALAETLGVTQATVSRSETAIVPDARYVLALEALERRAGTEGPLKLARAS